ncbi:uncharacterized protein AB9X84_009109 isoform 2-T3 [Acanthopagrus schlegelii]
MVRLSLIVLGLLVAAWCSTGAAEKWRVKNLPKYTQLSCRSGLVMKYAGCYRRKNCSGPTFTGDIAACTSAKTLLYMFRNCNLKRSCKVSHSFKKGSFHCQYRCERA